jgi:hypothetical protein
MHMPLVIPSAPPESLASNPASRHLRLAGFGLCVFLATQVYQALCFILWLPEAQSAAADLTARLGWLDRTRALAVLAGILALTVTYVVLAMERFAKAPLASALALVFTLFFIVLELAHRGIDFVLVSQRWASAFAAATGPAERDLILGRHALWESVTGAIYLPLMLSGLLAWSCFAIATWHGEGRWAWLAPLAFSLNALRTLGRLLGSYTDVPGMGVFNSLPMYVVPVLTINGMLATWLFWRAARLRECASLR